jgi:hypothetical protein
MNAASENWEELFNHLHDCEIEHVIFLKDNVSDDYDFANEILMPRMRERLVEALQEIDCIHNLEFGNKFFMTMDEQQQRSFFHSIFNLRVCDITLGEAPDNIIRVLGIAVREATDNIKENPAITISTSALLDTLPQLHTTVDSLQVSNFALTRQSDVQVLSNIILSKRGSLQTLNLESIECSVDDGNQQDSDESSEFLDPLFHVVSGLRSFSVSSRTRFSPVHSTLVSPTALRTLYVEGKQWKNTYELHLRGLGLTDSDVLAILEGKAQSLSLRGLGLTDSHVLAIADGLSTPGTHLDYLNLDSNPGISAQGYDVLLNLINQANVISTVSRWHGFRVEDKAWEGKLNLVAKMNSQYGRLEYMTNGTFTSDERRWQWLERVTDLPIPDYKWENEEKKHNAKHLNFIWYTLCQNPEMMQVSQAPTRTRKRKAM